MTDESDVSSVFIEQAEYINETDFSDWSATHPDERKIVNKLSAMGAKLITGPRGCGKTTLLLKAFHRLHADPRATALPVYANFKTSLMMEPLYHKKANANYWFSQWLVLKVILGLEESVSLQKKPWSEVCGTPVERLESFRDELELGELRNLEESDITFDISYLKDLVLRSLSIMGKKKCVLLLDDAAHAFSADQQRDFFDFFRKIKSREISPKAAIYPGVTIYSSAFHVGHDAQEIDVWIRPELEQYLPFMEQLIKRRLPEESYEALMENRSLFELLAYSSFGIPRTLLNSIRALLDESTGTSQSRKVLRRGSVLKEIGRSSKHALSLYRSLQSKLPIYERFIEEGENVLGRLVLAIKNYNKSKPENRKSVDIALQIPLIKEIDKTLAFLEYAGLVSPKGKVSRGEKGVFNLYTIHYGMLIDANAISVTKSPKPESIVYSLKSRNAHEFTRISHERVLGENDPEAVFQLALPPCHVCGTPRVSEAARFCMSCGAQLKTASTFENLVKQPIECLPLTETRVATIKQHSSIKTIRDILIDQGRNQLRQVPWVGPVWADRIYGYAEEYIA